MSFSSLFRNVSLLTEYYHENYEPGGIFPPTHRPSKPVDRPDANRPATPVPSSKPVEPRPSIKKDVISGVKTGVKWLIGVSVPVTFLLLGLVGVVLRRYIVKKRRHDKKGPVEIEMGSKLVACLSL